MKFVLKIILLLVFFCTNTYSQSKWQRAESVEVPLQLFHSTEVFDLPTTETLQKGDIYFSIGHKFTTPVSEGIDELFGFDGSVVMRIALGYAFTDDFLVKIGRSNHFGNYDLDFKYKLFNYKNSVLPLSIAIRGGIAYNSKAAPEPAEDSRLFQYFGNLIINTMLWEKLGVGIVPSALFNSNIYYPENINSFLLGAYLQYFHSSRLSVFAEAYPTLNGWRKGYDAYNLGVEINTGGHFFKFILGNNIYTNPASFMAGSLNKFESGDLHIGFVITRNL